MAAGSRTAPAAMLLRPRESRLPATIKTATIRPSVFPLKRASRSAIHCTTPVRSSAAVITKRPIRVLTAGRLKPASACSGVTTPVSPSASNTSSATRSGESRLPTSRISALRMTIKMEMQSLDTLFDYLCRFRAPDVFNQYAEVNLAYDRPDGAERRRGNMRRYLEYFHDAVYVLVSEAPGYAGCRFSGVSFTDERFLFGEQILPWVRAAGGFLRASRDDRPLSRE